METKKVLNLYAGIGGNRKLWEDVDVTAVENNEQIATIYQDFFPDDTVIVADAHQYLLDHFNEFDFIRSSPPCPSHSVTSHFLNSQGITRYPDMALYQEIILLDNLFKGKYCIENVKPYYEPLIIPRKIGRHCFWANFHISNINTYDQIGRMGPVKSMNNKRTNGMNHGKLGFDLSKHKFSDKTKLLNNCVIPELGKHIFDCAYRKERALRLFR